MAKPESKAEFFYNEKGLVTIGSPVKLQILNLLREEPRSFDEIVKFTTKAKSTVSVHLNNLRSCELVEENFDPRDRRRKIYSLTSRYMGCSQEPFIEHYRSLLKTAPAYGNDRFYFAEVLLHALYFGFEAYGINNAPVVKTIGNDLGISISPIFESETPEELLREIGDFLEFQGKCRVTVLVDLPALQIEDDFKARSIPVIGRSFCTLREGIIEGILKGKLEREYRVTETECYGSGHEHCLFKITV
jgi:predicted hydrocarbon binding protein